MKKNLFPRSRSNIAFSREPYFSQENYQKPPRNSGHHNLPKKLEFLCAFGFGNLLTVPVHIALVVYASFSFRIIALLTKCDGADC